MENQSFPAGPGPGPGERGAAAEQVKLPAIFLIILGVLGALYAVYGLTQAFSGVNEAQMAQALGDPNMPEQAKQLLEGVGKFSWLFSVIALVISGIVVFGGLKMKNLQNRGLAMAASIVAMLPLWSCCCLGIPVGIWSLVVLGKPEVKSSFS